MVTVAPTTHETEVAALELLFHALPPAERAREIRTLRERRDAGELSLAGLLVARDEGGDVVGVILGVPHGETGRFLWPPVVRGDQPETTTDLLLQRTLADYRRDRVELAQVLLEPEEEVVASRLVGNGFEPLAELEFQHRGLDAPTPEPSGSLVAECYDETTNHDRFEALLRASYVGTLDCPGLDERRSIASTMDGHRASGVFSPSRWWLFRPAEGDSEDAAILLMTDHPDEDAWEVVYVGVHHAHRGRGFGREAVAHGLAAARAAGRSGVLLAVDTGNRYAIEAYAALGFRPTFRRRVLVWYGDVE